MSLKDDILWQYSYHAAKLAKTMVVEKAAKELGLFERDDISAWLQQTGTDVPELQISFKPGVTVFLEAIRPATYMAELAKELLPKVGRWDKGFDETNNHLTLSTVYGGVKIILTAEPPKTCQVELIEENIEVPEKVIPAHTETKKRFVLKGDCDPLMASKEGEISPETVAVAIADDDIPF